MLELVKGVVKEAGKSVLSCYSGDVAVLCKRDSQPVTEADLVSEKIIISGLEKVGYPFLSEEREDDFARLKGERVFVVDPLDGTKEFLKRNDEFSIMVGLVERGRPVLGVVYCPVEDKLYYAVKDEGAYLQVGDVVRKICVSGEDNLLNFKMLLSRSHLLELEKKIASRLNIKNLVPCGSAGFKSCLISAGEADLYLNSSARTYEWDVCAADIIVSEAGGTVTDMNGEGIFYNKRDPKNLGGFLITNGKKHDRIVWVLNNFRK